MMSHLVQDKNYLNRQFRGILSFALSAFVWTMAMQAETVLADFSGPFAPANFSLSNSNANGSVNTGGAPTTISMTGGNNGSGSSGATTYTAIAPTAGRTGFNWAYTTSDQDGPNWDPFGYVQNGTFVQVTDDDGNNSQSGASMYSVASGQALGFEMRTRDNSFGSASATISNFLFSDTMYWKGNTDSSWGGANWTLDSAGTIATFAPDSTMNVVFSSAGSTNKNTVLGANFTIKSLTTSDSSPVTLGGTNTLTLSSSSGMAIDVQSGAGLLTVSANVSLAGSSNTLAVNNTAGAVISGVVGGGNGLIKSGSGTLTLSGNNTYAGLTDVQAGNLVLGASNVLANASTLKVSGGILSIGANSDTVSGVQLTGGSITGSTGVLTSTSVFDLQAGNVSAILGGAVGVNKTTSGTVFLSGNNTYTGVTTFGAGIVNVANLSDYGVAGSLGMRAVDTNPPVSNVGLRFVGGTLQYTGSTAQSTNRDIRVGLQGGTIDASGSNPSATMSFTKSTPNVDVWDTDGARTLTLTGSNTGDNTFGINWQERATGHSSIVKSGAGTWVLTNTHNSDAQTNAYNTYGGYGGGTTLTEGTLGFVANAVGGGVVDFTGNATLRWESGNTQDITSGSGAGIDRSVRIGDGVTATFNTNGNHIALSNAFALGASKSGALTKAGAGNLELSAGNTYTGATTISEGKLTIGSTGTINSTSGVSIGAAEFSYNSATALSKNVFFSGTGGTLSGTGTITNAVTVTSGNTYSAGAVGDPGTQAFANGITFQTGSVFSWDLDAPSADPGANSVNAGTYDKVIGNGSGTGIFNLVLGLNLFSDAFWDSNKTWTDIFSGSDPVFTLFSGGDGVSAVASNGAVLGQGQFSFSSGSLHWTSTGGVGPNGPISPVPEPTSALVGILVGAGLLRRKRR